MLRYAWLYSELNPSIGIAYTAQGPDRNARAQGVAKTIASSTSPFIDWTLFRYSVAAAVDESPRGHQGPSLRRRWLHSSEDADPFTRKLMREAIAVRRAWAVPLDDSLVDRLMDRINAMPGTGNSMQTDCTNGRPM